MNVYTPVMNVTYTQVSNCKKKKKRFTDYFTRDVTNKRKKVK